MDAGSEAATASRPQPVKTMSFSRFEDPRPTSAGRSRASTIQGTPLPEIFLQNNFVSSPEKERHDENVDIFSTQDGDVDALGRTDGTAANLPQSIEDLPIEIRSLTERFLESLSAKVHPTPLGIDALSAMFQDFYIRAESHISTHIASLSSRLSREQSPSPSVSSRVSRTSKSGTATPSRTRSSSDAAKQEQQMVSASEILDKRKARRLLELKRTALEEAVERAVCEKLYARLYRHRSTDDEERDQKLRSRVAALSLVGIGLKELLVSGTSEDLSEEVQKKVSQDEEQIKAWLGPTRDSLARMDEAQYPAAKLAHLTAAHKGIVETLGKMFPASSSADEVLPTLIYALLTTAPSEINEISNLMFIQRFRATGKVDGEAAYCLVNLEAAISFLETVDLPSLRKSERLQGPDKSTRPESPMIISTPMQLGVTPVDEVVVTPDSASDARSISPRPPPSPSKPNPRRLSTLTQSFQSGAGKIEAAGDSFRGAVLDSADQAFDAINSTLENSFRFMFGRLKEQQNQRSVTSAGRGDVPGGRQVKELDTKQPLVEMPKTLEDARKIVSPTIPSEQFFAESPRIDEGQPSASSDQQDEARSDSGVAADGQPTKADINAKIMDLVGGRRQMRDRSVDSSRSGGSAGKRVAFLDTGGKDPLSSSPNESPPHVISSTTFPMMTSSAPPPPIPSPGNQALEGIKGFGNSLNPFKSVGGLFGRGKDSASPGHSPNPSVTTFGAAVAEKETKPSIPNEPAAVPVALTPKEARALAGIEELKKLASGSGVSKKFLEMKDARDLKIGEVDELLKAYQALMASMRSVVDT